MTVQCKCGGRFLRLDIKAQPPTKDFPHTTYVDTNPIEARWKCDSCGKMRTQRKRQPKGKQ